VNFEAIAAIVSGVGVVAAAVVGGVFALRSANRANESSPYAELAKRVVALEISDRESTTKIKAQDAVIAQLRVEVDTAKTDLRTVTTHAVVVQDWIDNGATPPAPTVPEAVAALLRSVRTAAAHRHDEA
jgi:hypothetical protein